MKQVIFSLLTISLSATAFAQSILNADSPEVYREQKREGYYTREQDSLDASGNTVEYIDTVNTRQAILPYGWIDPKDEVWSKVTWEIIDLNERLNQIYYHSSDGLVSSNLSLFEAIEKGIKDGDIKQVYRDEYFKIKIPDGEAVKSLQATRTDTSYEDDPNWLDAINGGQVEQAQQIIDEQYVDTFEISNEYVRLIKLKGIWYIDKRLGELKYRLLGIGILGPDPKTLGQTDIANADELVDLFWVWYPDAREALANYMVFNPDNSSAPISYDDLLNARRFSSIIYKADTGFADGTIDSYLPNDAIEQLKESNRIKNDILQKENQMWNY